LRRRDRNEHAVIKILPLAIAILGSTLGPRAAWAAPTAERGASEAKMPERVGLEVDYQPLLEFQVARAAKTVALFTREDTEKALHEVHGVEVVDDPSVPSLVVRLSWIHYLDSIYRVEIMARRPGHEPEVITSIERHFVNDTALSEWVAGNLSDVLEELGRPIEEEVGELPPPEESEVVEVVEVVEEPEEIADDVETPPATRPLAAIGKVGIGLMGTGFVTAGVGVGLVVMGKKADEVVGLPLTRGGRDFRKPGIAVVVSGGVLMVSGAVLLVLDRRRAKRREIAGLWVAPARGGLQIGGRF